MLKGHTFVNQIFSNNVFSLFVNNFQNSKDGISSGFKNEMRVSYSGTEVTINSGVACIQGRYVEETTSTTLDAGASSLYCSLVIEIDLDKTNTESQFNQAYYSIVTSASSYPNLTKTDIVNNLTGKYQFELARFKTGSSGITDFQDRRVFLTDISNIAYPVGSIYTSSSSSSPESTLGGKWNLLKKYCGGELIAYGTANNGTSQSAVVAKDSSIAFSDGRIPQKSSQIVSFVDGVLNFTSGTFSVIPKGIVGMVEAKYSLSGLGGTGISSLWFGENSNPLPKGVVLQGDYQVMKTITPSYCGADATYQYIVNDEADSNADFFINPTASAYGGTFTPCIAGTKCNLQVKVFAKKGVTYVWERVS